MDGSGTFERPGRPRSQERCEKPRHALTNDANHALQSTTPGTAAVPGRWTTQRPGRPHAIAQQAFSLIEILIVLGLIITLMGLSMAAFVSAPRQVGIAGAEQMLAATIRQARATARIQGAAVVLQIDAADGQIAGLSRTIVAAQSFDSTGGQTGNAAGLAGRGFVIEPLANPTDTPVIPESLALTRADLPLRDGRKVGFRLSCAVRSSASGLIPVAAIGTTATPKAPVLFDPHTPPTKGTAAILLDSTTRNLINDQGLTGTFASSGVVGQIRLKKRSGTWDDGNDTRWFELSTLDRHTAPNGLGTGTPANLNPPDPDLAPAHPARYGEAVVLHPTVSDFDIAEAMTPGAWERIALVFDGGRRLYLERAGRRVAELTLIDDATPVFDDLTTTAVGAGGWDSGGNTIVATPGVVYDDLRLEQLGYDTPGRMPQGVQITSGDALIVCHADGRVEAPATITIKKDSVTAEITITSQGAVSSRMVP